MNSEPSTETMNGAAPRLRRGYSSVEDEATFAPSPEPGTVSRIGYRFYLINLVLILYLYSIAVTGLLSIQFIYFKLSEFAANTSYPDNSSTCSANISKSDSDDENDIQKKAASLQIYLAICSGIPSMFTCVLFGALSDRLGRRMLFGIPVCGTLIRASVYALVDYTNASLYYLIIGHVFDGLSGGFCCVLLGAFAGSADTTSGGKNRTFRIAITESCGTLSVGLGSLTLGYLIEGYGFIVPNILVVSVCVVNLLVIIFAVPETHAVVPKTHIVVTENGQAAVPLVPREKLNMRIIKQSVSRVFKFYLKQGEGYQRLRFILCWVAFFLASVTFIGSNGVETLFQKRYPLCWGSVKIGYFGSIKAVGSAIAVVLVIKLLQCCLGDIGIGIFCLLGKIASYVLEAFSTTDLEMFLVAIIGMAAIGVMAMLRSIMSKFTPREDLGAMFASIAFAETTTTIVGGVLFNSVYQSTVSTQPGFVFIIMALILVVVLVIYCILFCVIRVEKRRARAKLDEEKRPLLDKDIPFY